MSPEEAMEVICCILEKMVEKQDRTPEEWRRLAYETSLQIVPVLMAGIDEGSRRLAEKMVGRHGE